MRVGSSDRNWREDSETAGQETGRRKWKWMCPTQKRQLFLWFVGFEPQARLSVAHQTYALVTEKFSPPVFSIAQSLSPS